MIFDFPTQTPTAPLLAKLKWMSLMDKVLYRKAVMVYKSLNGLAPGYMQDMFKCVTNVNVRSSCNADESKLYLPGGKKMKKYTDNFSFSGGMIWNTIPSDVREVESLTAFKSSYVKWYRQ